MKPHVALIAHDRKKPDIIAFALHHKQTLEKFHLIATRTTGELVSSKAGLPVVRYQSGPKGGDVQIAAKVVEGEIHGVIFLVDPLEKHSHDPDIQTLLRACNVHNVPLATNLATAEILILGLSVTRS